MDPRAKDRSALHHSTSLIDEKACDELPCDHSIERQAFFVDHGSSFVDGRRCAMLTGKSVFRNVACDLVRGLNIETDAPWEIEL